jgi:hypothetical protein
MTLGASGDETVAGQGGDGNSRTWYHVGCVNFKVSAETKLNLQALCVFGKERGPEGHGACG